MIWWLFGIVILVAMVLIYWNEKRKLDMEKHAAPISVPNIPPIGNREKVKLSINGKMQTGYRAPRPGDDGYYYYYDNDGRFIDDSIDLIIMIEILSDYNSAAGQCKTQEEK